MTNKNTTHDRIAITVDGQPKELFMSFGLLSECLAIVQDLPNVAMLGIQAELRNSVLFCVLSERDPKGKIVGDGYNPFVTEVSTEDAMVVIRWVAEHTLSFFLKAMESNLRVHQAHEGDLNSMASGLGSKGSLSKKVAAGSTGSPQAD
jgi:hypothetical protein